VLPEYRVRVLSEAVLVIVIDIGTIRTITSTSTRADRRNIAQRLVHRLSIISLQQAAHPFFLHRQRLAMPGTVDATVDESQLASSPCA
jgi:hypothetical protein